MRAYDVATGEARWAYGEGRAGNRLMLLDDSNADRVVVLTDDSDGVQTLSVLRLCGGDVLTERPVEDAYLDGRMLDHSQRAVSVALGSTTLLAHLVERGAPLSGDETDDATDNPENA